MVICKISYILVYKHSHTPDTIYTHTQIDIHAVTGFGIGNAEEKFWKLSTAEIRIRSPF